MGSLTVLKMVYSYYNSDLHGSRGKFDGWDIVCLKGKVELYTVVESEYSGKDEKNFFLVVHWYPDNYSNSAISTYCIFLNFSNTSFKHHPHIASRSHITENNYILLA